MLTSSLLLLLSTTAALGHYTYPAHYIEEEYQYDEDKEEESEAEFVPVFLSSPHTVRVRSGARARLECAVDRLGPMVMSWSKVTGSNTSYLVTGSMVLVSDPRIEVQVTQTVSTLLIRDTRQEDEGEYQCSVSSHPPVHIKLWLKLSAPPEVEILGRPSTGVLSVRSGEELALVCQGRGEPPPHLVWMREESRLPDGSSYLSADQLIFSRVSPSHSGVYSCTGGTAKQSLTVKVLHPPLVTLDQSYHHSTGGGSRLELVCTVQAEPPATVEWWRSGLSLAGLGVVGGRAKVEYRDKGRHVLTLNSPVQEDLGPYSCSANNSEGAVKVSLDLKDPSIPPTVSNLTSNNSSPPPATPQVVKTLADQEHEEESHQMLKHIIHKMNKFDKLSHDIVSAIKESNRFLYQILRNQKKILTEETSLSPNRQDSL